MLNRRCLWGDRALQALLGRRAVNPGHKLPSQQSKRCMKGGSGGWMGTGDDQSADSAMELAEEQFAQALASRGGLGLSKLIVQGPVFLEFF
jgi:hypothetical protein